MNFVTIMDTIVTLYPTIKHTLPYVGSGNTFQRFFTIALMNLEKFLEVKFMDIKKIRRRIEDVLRKSSDEVILKIAKILGVKIDENRNDIR